MDLDDTLLDRAGAFQRWTTQFLDAHGLPPEAHDWLRIEDRQGRRDKVELFDLVIRRYELDVGAQSLADAFRVDFPSMFSVEADVVAHLSALRTAGWALAIVTNGFSYQRQKLEAVGLADFFDALVISAEVGLQKPDAQIFQAAATECGRPLGGAWMIGDDPLSDILGAHRLGLKSIWITRGRSWCEQPFKPTFHASDIGAALQIVRHGYDSRG